MTDIVQRVVALVPAHNEEESIAATIEGLLAQRRVPDEIVVIADNCTDQTLEVASRYPVTAVASVGNTHKKPGAMNWAWRTHCQGADLVVTLDADTYLPPNAVSDWVREFEEHPKLGGSSSKFTMLGDDMLTRLQRAEFASWTHTSLRRGWTSVLAGTGCAIRNIALSSVAELPDREGPWLYVSAVEDFELTHQIRAMGWFCHVSPTVRAYTDSMKTVSALWGQRMKWQVGTLQDLLRLGVSSRTALDWRQQALGLGAALIRLLWPTLVLIAILSGQFQIVWWWALPTALFVLNDVKQTRLIPHRDKGDVWLAASFVPRELFAYMRAAWFLAAWHRVLLERITGRSKDLWEQQYVAEAKRKRRLVGLKGTR
jgi:cellulose synthase/poly-beta-1,6-N-acetylglucosamine synthase-like glycosyltransferase